MTNLFSEINFSFYVSLMNDTFDSHDLIECIMRHNPEAYILAIAKYSDKNVVDSIRLVDSQIARYLNNHSQELGIENVGEHESLNVLNNDSPCATWRKLG